MENFAAAILSNSASDMPADILQWLHIMNFFVPLTPSAPSTRGICGTQGLGKGHGQHLRSPRTCVTCSLAKGTGDFYRLGWQKLLWPKILILATDLIQRCPASIKFGWYLRTSLCTEHVKRGHFEKIKKLSWHTDFQLQDHNNQSLGQNPDSLMLILSTSYCVFLLLLFFLFVWKIFKVTNSWKTALFQNWKS